MDGLRGSVGALVARSPLLRSFFLIALLFAELLFLTLRYDTQPLQATHQWWAWPMSHARAIPQLGIAALTGILLIGGRKLLRSLEDQWSQRTADPWINRYFIAHVGLYVVFIVLTARICGPTAEATEFDVIAWMALAGSILLTWIGAFLSPTTWPSILRGHAVPIIVGAVVGAIAWGAGGLTSELWSTLADLTLRLVAVCLWMMGLETVVAPETHVVGTAAFQVEVSSACCGYEGVGLLWVFVALYLFWFYRQLRFPAALILFPIGTVAMLAVNVLRISLLIVIGNAGWRDLAIGGFHSQAGWMGFNIVALSLVALFHRSPILWRPGEQVTKTCPHSGLSVAAYLNPFLTIVAVSMVSRAFTNEPDNLYPFRVLLSALVLFIYRTEYQRLRWSVSAEPILFGILGAILWIALVKPGDGGSAIAPSWYSTDAAVVLWFLFRLAGSIVTVPIAEELAFRGYFLNQLKSSPPLLVGAVAGSSLLFGLMHGNIVAGTLVGVLYATVFLRRQSLGDSVAAHATTNALLAVYALSTGQWWLWS